MSSTDRVHELESQLRDLDARLRPIAERPVDIRDHDWLKTLETRRYRLVEARIRPQAETLLRLVTRVYRGSSPEDRQRIRELFEKYDAFAWAAALPERPTTDEGFREHLLWFSVVDQGRDSRDAILWLRHLCTEARDAGVVIAPILREVAALSSDNDKYAMGSTRKQLADAAG